jgi:preprotein translocase subunit SecG
MFTFIITLIVITSLLLILVVLAQNSKGGGLSSQFGGSGTSQVMGVKRTGDILERMTWGLAFAILILSLSTKMVLKDEPAEAGMTSPNIERAEQQNIMPNLNTEIPLGGADTSTTATGLEGLSEEN